MFSKDGYGWSANEIEHDQKLPEASFGGASLKLYHGDIIEMPFRYDGQEDHTLVVMVTDSGEDILFDISSGEVDTVQGLWPPPHRPFAHSCVGSIWTSLDLQKRCSGVLRAFNAEHEPGLEMIVQASAALCLGVVLAGVLQWLFLSEVGPLTALFGGFVSSIGILAVWYRLNPHLFSRRWSIAMTWRVALFCGFNAMAVAYVLEYTPARIVGLGAASVLCSGLIWLLSTDLIAWKNGGYQRENQSERRSGVRWD